MGKCTQKCTQNVRKIYTLKRGLSSPVLRLTSYLFSTPQYLYRILNGESDSLSYPFSDGGKPFSDGDSPPIHFATVIALPIHLATVIARHFLLVTRLSVISLKHEKQTATDEHFILHAFRQSAVSVITTGTTGTTSKSKNFFLTYARKKKRL